jgi:hypothetical protein
VIALEYLIFVIIFWGIPLSLVGRAWRLHLSANCPAGHELFLPRTALILLSIPVGILILTTGLANSGKVGSTLIPHWDSVMLSIWNLALSIGALLLSLGIRRTSRESARVKRATLGASVYLTFAWLLLMGH